MARMGRIRTRSEEDTELNMVPIMNLFMVLIPFLLMSTSFLHLKAVNASVPVHAEAASESTPPPASDIKVTVMVSLGGNRLSVSASANGVAPEILSGFEKTIVRTGRVDEVSAQLGRVLAAVKEKYPKSDTMVLVPEPSVLYEEIVRTMDMARNRGEDALFPNVVLSGSLG